MKKPISAILVLVLTAASAAASNKFLPSPGDPKKDKTSTTTISKPETSFSLSSGYFSFFNLFLVESAVSDSLKTSGTTTYSSGSKTETSRKEN
ncbi:MAG: hypothetical protein SH856_08695 [Flavobacteriales bacterium]|nr:hypothetical protein [Flavobacteriales bacterium]